MGVPREVPDRSNVENSLRMRLSGSSKFILSPKVTARLLSFTATLVVRLRLLFFKVTMELG